MYLDSAYIAKYYLNEWDADAVRRVIHSAESLVSSEWSIVEVTCAFHRHLREGRLTARHYQDLLKAFRKHVREELWTLGPINSRILARAIARNGLAALPNFFSLERRGSAHLGARCRRDGGVYQRPAYAGGGSSFWPGAPTRLLKRGLCISASVISNVSRDAKITGSG